VLYWLFSNVLAIAHQYYYQRAQKAVAVAVKGQDA
jgi:membrane protein insertase Oxa1/YidC/SpoIIIJ